MKHILLFFTLTTFQFSFAGTIVLEGQIVDDITKQPIIYANVGIVGGNKGTVTNQSGFFSLTIPDTLMGNNLRISNYGYESLVMKVSAFEKLLTNGAPVVLGLKQIVLEIAEATVVAPTLKEKMLGRKAESGTMVLGFSSDELGTEIGVFIKVKNKSYLDDFNFFVSNSIYDSLTFRINFYACDKHGNPKDSLLAESIVFKLDSISTGKVRIDLREYHLSLSEDTYLSLEVVSGFTSVEKEEGDNKPFQSGLFFGAEFGGHASYRYTSQANWENIPMVAPGLYLNARQVVK